MILVNFNETSTKEVIALFWRYQIELKLDLNI